MIHYDSHRWCTLVRLNGSVLPKAILWALPSACFAFFLKYFEEQGLLSLDKLTVMSQGDIYSGFTFVLGFSLVFRTSQSYLRYWTAATSVHEMGSEWSDSCASLIAFATVSKMPYADIMRFRHTVVRLFSLLHAMALAEIASVGEDLPLLDVQGFGKQQLLVLTSELAQGRKVQIVLSWIKAYIIQMADKGLLNVPPPILTRVFQELGAGLVQFHKAKHIVIWPFPFPYTQLNLLLIHVYTIITPLVICTWQAASWVCGSFTFVSVTCMIGLDLIASELENPFGDDPNDLPVVDLQGDMNKFLTMQLNPVIHNPPELSPNAMLDYRRLVFQCTNDCDRFSLNQLNQCLEECDLPEMFMKEVQSTTSNVVGPTKSWQALAQKAGMRRDRMRAQLRWRGQVKPDSEAIHMQQWLKCGRRSPSVEHLHETMYPELFPPEPHMQQEDSHTSYEDCIEEDTPVTHWSAWAAKTSLNGSEAEGIPQPADTLLRGMRWTVSGVPAPSEKQSNFRQSNYRQSTSSLVGPKNGCSRGSTRVLSPDRRMASPRTSVAFGTGFGAGGGWGSEGNAAPPASPPADWGGPFLNALHQEFREHLDAQLEVQKRELKSIEGALLGLALKADSPRRPTRRASSEGRCPSTCPAPPPGRFRLANLSAEQRGVPEVPRGDLAHVAPEG